MLLNLVTTGIILLTFAMNTIMGNAIYPGLYGAESQDPSQDLLFQFRTGNCTWSSEIISLGVCSESAHISAHLTSDCQSTPGLCIFVVKWRQY